jgi:hypothetical protein
LWSSCSRAGLRWTRQRSGARGQGQGGLLSVSPKLRADERRCKASSRRRLSNRHRRDAGSEYNLSLSRAAKLKRSRRACTAIAASAGASKCKDNQCHQQDVEHAQREYGDIENADQADHGVLRYTPTGCYDASATTGCLCSLCLLGDHRHNVGQPRWVQNAVCGSAGALGKSGENSAFVNSRGIVDRCAVELQPFISNLTRPVETGETVETIVVTVGHRATDQGSSTWPLKLPSACSLSNSARRSRT